ncbi:hypothetical protein JOQ06_027573 [Pogonophryne albipinna]|uniref:Uncharacterized protein n=1 Tax=Pogonophryne albipinna TaxID=1090488 RepID=A0AAD6FN04_9TELE|nr:hypothetical protein JOQ06_027573 [Pogonophryne albipinna]
MEEARDEVSRILLTLEERELISLLVETTLDEIEEDEESAESYQQYLQHVLSYLASLKPTPGETEAEIVIQETSELEKLKMQYQRLQQQMEEEIGALEEKIKRKTQAAGGDTAPASVTAKRDNQHPSRRALKAEPADIRTRTRQHQTGEPEEDSDSESSDEVELVCRFPYDQELSQRAAELNPAADLNPEAEPFAPALTMQDGAPDLEDATVAQEETETDNRGITAHGDGENGTAEPGESLQESSEEDDPDPPPATSYPQRHRHRPRQLTYNALGEPTWEEAGAESLHVVSMSPACNPPVMWRPWASLDVEVMG